MEVLYDCLSIADIQYEKHRFYADTIYNGLSVSWIGEDFFPETLILIDKFISAKKYGDHVMCKYAIENDLAEATLEMLWGNYRITKVNGGNWIEGKECIESQPDHCEFFIETRV